MDTHNSVLRKLNELAVQIDKINITFPIATPLFKHVKDHCDSDQMLADCIIASTKRKSFRHTSFPLPMLINDDDAYNFLEKEWDRVISTFSFLSNQMGIPVSLILNKISKVTPIAGKTLYVPISSEFSPEIKYNAVAICLELCNIIFSSACCEAGLAERIKRR